MSTHTEAPKPSRAAAPAVAAKGTRVEEPEHTEPASSEPATAAETTEEAAQHPGISIEEVDSGCCLLVEGAKDGEVSPSVKSADLSPVGEFSSQSALSPGEREQDNFADDETSSQASSTSDSSERHCSRTTSGDEVSSGSAYNDYQIMSLCLLTSFSFVSGLRTVQSLHQLFMVSNGCGCLQNSSCWYRFFPPVPAFPDPQAENCSFCRTRPE